MRIVVTGGWGYGNMGDDAILASTIQMIESAFPNCIIDVLTYDISDSDIHKRQNVHLHKSMHAHVDFSSSECFYKKLGKDYPLYTKFFLEIKARTINSQLWSNINNFTRYDYKIKNVIKSADLLVVAGGGYFNENWMSSLMSHLAEIKIAIDLNIPFCVTGITLGTISNCKINDAITRILKQAISIYVRDYSSFQQLKDKKIETKYIPDIALSNWRSNQTNKFKHSKKHVIGIIINNNDKFLQKNICLAMSKLFTSSNNQVIKIILSRRWKRDFEVSLTFQRMLERYGQNSLIVIPESHKTLENELTNCDLVLSENLHGLILAARNLIPIVGINNYHEKTANYKKINSFLEQINTQELVINKNQNHHKISYTIKKAYLSKEEYFKQAFSLRERTKNETEIFFNDLKPLISYQNHR